MAFTCPRCGRTSRHPEDACQGYCGACHDWTGPGVPGEGTARFYQCETCGHHMAVPPEHVGRVWCPCGSARAMAPAPWVVDRVTEGTLQASGIRVVTDPSVPSGHIVLRGAHGLWQFAGPAEFSVPAEFVEERPGSRSVDVAALARYVGERYGALTAEGNWSSGFVTIPHTDSGSGSDSGDGIPWSDPMVWRSGDVEW